MFWIVLAEIAVMFALFAVAWRVYESHRAVSGAAGPAPPSVATAPVVPGKPTPVPPPAVRSSPSPAGAKPPRPFPVDLGQLNHDQAALERVEGALLARVVEAAHLYLETVVLPAVRRAESVNRATIPAAAQSPAAIRKMP
jgi:hypothetical protein